MARDASFEPVPVALATTDIPAVATALMDELRRRRLIVPGPSVIERLVAAATVLAERHVAHQLTRSLSPAQCEALDALLLTKEGTPMSVQAWARQPPGAPGHRALARVVEQRAALRAIALDQSWAKGVHPERFRKLAREGARFTAQHLPALSPLRRRVTLVATALDTITRLTDDTTTRPGSPHRPDCTNAPPPLASKRTTSRPCTPTSISISAGSAMRSCVRISRASSRPAISSDLPRVSPPHSGQD